MEKFKYIKKQNIEALPKNSGVYCFVSPKSSTRADFTSGKKLLYIGKAINIKNRVKNHFSQPSYRDNLFVSQVEEIGFRQTNSEIEALILEANLIKKYQPKYNVMWRDDKNYFYVAIAKNIDGIPYVFITHQLHPHTRSFSKNFGVGASQKLQTTHYKPQTQYIGPFVGGTALRKTLRFLRRAFPYYSTTLRHGSGQAKHSKNKCTYCHLGLCPGPGLFENPPSPEASARLREYRKNIKKLILILKGKRNIALSLLKEEMKQLSKENKFEEAGKIRDKIYNLQQVMAHTRVIDAANTAKTSDVSAVLAKIASAKNRVSRVECYDVSNIQGTQATGSMVVFIDGKPDKNKYRKFKIKTDSKPNDIAMLKEILERRFAHKEWSYPEIILIDGGRAQLNIAVKSKIQNPNFKSNPKIQNIKILSIAKRNRELFIEGRNKPALIKSLPRGIYNLILQLDDEAHRFAISYHKALRRKNLLNNELVI